jgi:1-acyl-sn-glycerol-3-phosphate acyltransferase
MAASSHAGTRERIRDAASRDAVYRLGTWDDVTVFYWWTKDTLGMTLKIVFRPRAWGVKNVPRRGPVILASNHLSFSDHFFGPLPLPRKVVFLGKAEYFTGRGLKGLLSKVFFTGGRRDSRRPGRGRGERAGHQDQPAGPGGRERARHS